MSDVSDDERRCERCGRPLDEEAVGGTLCFACAALLADGAVGQREKAATERERESAAAPERRRRILLVAIIVVSVAVIAWRVPALLEVFERERPLRVGVSDTDAETDACIENLWEAASELQQGRRATSLVCPATGEPYVYTEVGDDTVVSCPNPEEHGLTILESSRLEPAPKVVR